MALRLRRGTDAERQLIIPAEGEPLYVTDTKSLFVGDGATIGGNELINGNASLADLSDTNINASNGSVLMYNNGTWFANFPLLESAANVFIDGPQAGDVLTYDADLGTWISQPPVSTEIIDGGDFSINIVADDSSVIIDASTGTFTGSLFGNVYGEDSAILIDASNGTFNGRLAGDVFSNDGTLLIDADNKWIVGTVKTAQIEAITESILLEAEVSINSRTNTTSGSFNFRKGDGTSELRTGPSNSFGDIKWHADDVNGNGANIHIQGSNKGLKIFTMSDYATLDNSSSLIFDMVGNFGIGTQSPTEKVHVQGNALVTGFVQFGSLSTVERDALTAVNGMVIYNITDNKFQGYEAGSWVNLI